MIKYLSMINFRHIVRELAAIKSLVGYSLFLYVALGVLAPPKANAGASCTLASGKSAAILNSSGQVIEVVTGPQDFSLYDDSDSPSHPTTYRIYINEWITVYRKNDTDQYIDINSLGNCKVWSPPPAPNDIRRKNRN
jgi:hypothetical protein